MNWNLLNAAVVNPLTLFMILLVNSLAAYRLSRIIARDTVLDRPRNAITNRYHGSLVDLMLCIWCLSFWFAIAAVLLTVWSTTREAWLVIASILSISAVAGQLSERS
jgi:hypothetical protein